MIEHPCFKCKYHRYGKDTGDSLRNALGFYVCIEDSVHAVIMDSSSLKIIELHGCQKRVERGKD
jgi:hypothetical protein